MARYVAFFRGVNVGKAKRLAMDDLRSLLQALGYADVRTLLNSGNALFSTRAASAKRMASRIRSEVARKLGVDALVIVKSAKDIAAIVADNALQEIASDPARLLVALNNEARPIAALESLAKRDWGDERVHVGRHAAYLWCAHGILESRAAGALLGSLAGAGTTRNWATLRKIHALLNPGAADER
jgi:uncharacterized protein (DUF1697 family)